MARNMRIFGEYELVKMLTPEVSPARKNLKFALLMLVLALLVVMLARPQFGSRNEEVKRSGMEVIIAVDISNSMLCEDIKPNRLAKSKMLVSKLIEQFDEDRIGLVTFAGTALTLLPVTSDYVSAKMFLDQMDPSSASMQGTNISDAITKASNGFSSKKSVGHALIIITDAEDHEPGALEAAKLANEKGQRIFVLSVGTSDGGAIPIGNNEYKTDREGNTVITKINENVAKDIAQAGNGVYMHVDQTDSALDMLKAEFEKMEKEESVTSMYSEYDEQFVAVAILLLITLVLEVCVIEKKNPALSKFKLFK
jgi:Ca-activated chloride channel family protein